MLDDREQQVLAALERDLAAEDPGLRTRLERTRAATWWPAGAAVTGVVVAVLLMALGLVGNAFLLLLVALAPLALRCWRRRPPPSSGPRRRDG